MRDCKNCKHLIMYDYKNKSYSCEKWECKFEPEEQEPTTKNDLGVQMTNGKKMISAFPNGEVRKCEKGVVFSTGGWCHAYDDAWWNAEYKGPTTKNDSPHCQHTDEEISQSFIEDVEAVKDQLPCGQMMDFPNTFDEFAKDYGFKDKKEIYTNGSELIPVFRVKQWLEHIATTKNDLGVDCISRKAALDITWHDPSYSDPLNVLTEVRDKIRELPSVTPQEPKWIPVSEKLPNDRDWYLGIFREPDTGWINPLPFICDYVGSETKATTKEHWILRGFTDRDEHIDYYFNLECVVWMPLPKPYEPQENEDKE